MTDNDQFPQNPIVAMASRIRARRDLGAAIDSATADGRGAVPDDDADTRLAALADVLAIGTKRLNSILGKSGVTLVRIEKPLRLRLRFAEKRISIDLDRVQQLVRITGLGLDGEYQFDTAAPVPALINLSKLSTSAGYGDAVTGSSLLKLIAADAELPRPAHLDATGPISLQSPPSPRSRGTDKP
jgi:hypothetical protein